MQKNINVKDEIKKVDEDEIKKDFSKIGDFDNNKIKVNRSVAEYEFEKYCNFWELDISEDEESSLNKDKIISAIMRGRIAFNESEEKFIYKLRKPINLENGNVISEIIIGEPKSKDMHNISEKNLFQSSLKMISACSGQPLGVIDRLGMKDITILSTLMAFFA